MDKTRKKNIHVMAEKKRRNWYIHLLIFAILQLVFFIFDNRFSWSIFGLNDIGEWFVSDFTSLKEGVQIYDSQPLNSLLVIWGIVLLIDTIITLYFMIRIRGNGKTE
ncbi:hypothetical protein SAMN05216389_11256 [Oceanobacillus limi]|uniref:YfzA-like protein n=1 Tax=Oceanobacillus limi TaxID=930131 RepID=A0A1I0EQR5_9BACI|nr:hypothetical protein [Oceanobacillus limi]SET47798.1 hypothetical protein SAMN05216389_11256 [Oceanobacillus limi]